LEKTYSPVYPDSWSPSSKNPSHWTTDRAASPFETIALPSASKGKTAVAGRVLSLDGLPVEGVNVSSNNVSASTNSAGQFLLTGVKPGRVVLTVDARPASTDSTTFGVFQIGVDVDNGQTV